MFQGRDDRANRVKVALTMADNSVLMVSLRTTLSGRLGDVLNNSDQFLDVLTVAGEQQFIAKSQVRAVRSAVVPRADQMDLDAAVTKGSGALDPYEVLKIGRDASQEDIRHAYHRMARLYHPDRIASYELPEEMKEYARAMLARINLAFEQIER